MNKNKLKIGVAGAGHLGNIHLKCLAMSDCYEIVGLYDVNSERAAEMSEAHGLTAFNSLDAMLDEIDALDVVTPTTYHAEVAAQAIKAGKHVFIEKPVTTTVAEAIELKKLKDHHRVKVQIGHVERFNPAMLALKDHKIVPGFIEGHRLAQFNPRGTDVSVILDLMIHDLDLILKLVGGEVVDIQSKRVSVVSKTDDICNARLTFDNGCVVNLTASRISLKSMRKLRVFSEDAYISIDLLEKQTQIISLTDAAPGDDPEELLDTAKGLRKIDMYLPEILPVNAILMELETFYQCIVEDTTPYVSLEDGIRALDLAYKIMNHES
jgi:predicted dehydrogenase